ncbi:putative reverse transcriptase domain-containing protein [Tanacetum coccineum]|uniref:Reverse transcriptase domain-containing protein n=1 Tax=Tanacetum coccineum TaxID=301880 RepID=A0ABQ5BAY7_9ASTR
MLRAFPMSLIGVASRWLRNKPSGSITTWEDLKTKNLSKYCPPARTVKKMEEINNFQQEPNEILYHTWERFKELLMKCPQHYLTEMQEVVLFYNGLNVPTRQILDSRGAIPSKTDADAKVAIQEMDEYSQKWNNRTSRTRSTKTSDGLAAIQAQLNNLGREIKKVNEKVYAAQVGCEQCKGPHYTKDSPLKEEGKTLEDAHYTQFGTPFQGEEYKATAPGFYQRNNANPSYQERRQSMEETLSKFLGESAKRHEENSNLIKEIQASMDATIRNQGASIKTLEIQIGKMSKVLWERGFRSLASSTKTNLRDHVKLISTTVEAGASSIHRIGSTNTPYPLDRTVGVVEEFRARNDARMVSKFFGYPSDYDHDKKICIDCAHNLKFSCMIDFAVLEDMDAYRDEGMGDVIFGKPFLREVGINARRFEGMITIYNGNEEVTYQMVSEEDKMNGISHPYQKLKSFYKGVLNLGPEYVRDATMEEWLTCGHISVHEMV